MTEFNVRSGQTLVLGGFLSRERSVERTGLPLLSDIPLLGNLFSTRRTQVRDTELAIFVTPSIVSHDYAGFDQTARRAQRALQQAFPEPPQMGPLPLATPGRGWVGPNGAGSQWQTPGAFPSSGAY